MRAFFGTKGGLLVVCRVMINRPRRLDVRCPSSHTVLIAVVHSAVVAFSGASSVSAVAVVMLDASVGTFVARKKLILAVVMDGTTAA